MSDLDLSDDDLGAFGEAALETSLGSRRGASKKDQAAAVRRQRLELLKKTRSGTAKRSDLLRNDEPATLFDELSEDDYKRYLRNKIEQDDFVVDDDGKGYADYGDDFDGDKNNESEDDDESEAEEDGFGKRKSSKKANTRVKKVAKEARVTTFFNKQAAKQAASKSTAVADNEPEADKPRVVKKKQVAVVNEQDLLDDIFGDMDNNNNSSSSSSLKNVVGGSGGAVDNDFDGMERDGAVDDDAPVFGSTRNSALEPPVVFKFDGILGDFHASRERDIFANSFERMLSDNEDEDLIPTHDVFAPYIEEETQPSFDADMTQAPEEEETQLEAIKPSLIASSSTTDAAPADSMDTSDQEKPVDEPSAAASPPQQQRPPAPRQSAIAASSMTIRKLETTTSTKTKLISTAKFIPKFEPVQKPTAPGGEAAGCASWTSVMDSLAVGDSNTPAAVGNSSLGVAGNTISAMNMSEKDYFEEDGRLFAYWFDAYEKDGVVYLFAKVLNKTENKFVSCCLTVNNIDRVMFVLPRLKKRVGGVDTDIDVTMTDVYEEFDNVRSKFGVKQHKSRVVSRKYAFEIPGVPVESDYLKVAYSYKYNPIPLDTSGQCFSHIFGTNANALENFIIKRKIMGPCWLEIKSPALSRHNISWAKLEIQLEGPKMVSPLTESQLDELLPTHAHLKSPPPFVAMSISLRTVMNHQKSSNEIVVACAMVYTNVSIDGTSPPSVPLSYSAIRPLTDVPMPVGLKELVANAKKSGRSIETLPNEKGLLNYLIAIIHRSDPDIIVGHNFIGVDLDILLHRLKANKVDSWSKLGRLRKTKWPKLQIGAGGMGDTTFQERTVASGRILCDTFMSAKEYVTKAKSYTLTNMAMTQLKIARQDLDVDKIPRMFWDAGQLMWLLKHCETDCVLSASLMMKLQVLPLTKQLTSLAGNLWARTIMAGSRADRNEFLLLHEFHNKKFIVPDKTHRNNRPVVDLQRDDDDEANNAPRANVSARRKPAYAGGLVLEPKKGLYEKFVLMLDFNSLYPSIIQEFNICFTTVERPPDMDDETVPEPPDPSVPQGILPKLLATLVERRRAVKGLMKNPKLSEAEYSELNIRQQALKLTANSMYGCLGFTHSRFYAKPLAMLVTQRGREILQSTVDLATTEKLEVIYGDTDSIMIHTNTDTIQDVLKCGNEFKRAVNKRYRLLEIEIDGIFKKMLLLKKKKYAALIVEEKDGKMSLNLEKKGLDVVRRDWCNLSHDASEFVLSAIFSDDGRDEMLSKIHDYLSKLGEDVKNGDVAVDKFVINKGLTKNPEEYSDVKNQPHVQVALNLKKKGIPVRVGDTVPYVIVIGEGTGLAARAQHPDELRKPDTEFKIDYQYYLANQVLPPLSRLLSPIDGTDQSRIAACLGLDASKFHTSVDSAEMVEEKMYTLESTISDEERFKKCEKFHVQCPTCHTSFEFSGLVKLVTAENGETTVVTGMNCENPSCYTPIPVGSFNQQMLLAVRANIRRFMIGYTICDERECGARTRAVAVYGKRCQRTGCRGTLYPEYTDGMLLTQLQYFKSLFSQESVVIKYEKNRRINETQRAVLHLLSQQNQEDASPVLRTLELYIHLNARGIVDLGKIWGNMGLGSCGAAR
ncbi:UNVERIFIED_CONTAM: DNA-directed DNA polymerase alpha catalytic subunit pol1 [Siphonaria sp. JEL0065]|nr:DNA-directed DNA polymerase alpha catalytic subunit pol1 [Siphonaria sp. JEL0065]